MFNKINPSDIGVGISIVGKQAKDGSVTLKCDNETKDIKLVQTKIQDELGSKYVVKEKPLSKNRVKIVGINDYEHHKDQIELVSNIVNQNDLNPALSELNVLFKSKCTGNKFYLIINVNEYAFKELINKEKIFIGWSRCRVYEDYGIIRCYKCCQYGHTKNLCKNNETCPHCGDSHRGDTCGKTVIKCINCERSNNRFKLTLDTNHAVFDKECPTYKRIIDVQKRKFENVLTK